MKPRPGRDVAQTETVGRCSLGFLWLLLFTFNLIELVNWTQNP